MEDKKGSKKVKIIIIATAAILALSLVSMMPVISNAQTNISIGDTSAPYCNITTIPIMINVTDPTGLGAATINLTYNPNVCVVTNVVKGPNSFDSLTSSHPYTNTSGYVKMVASQTGGTGVGPGLVNFADITFHAVGTEKEKSPLNLTIETLKNNTGEPLEYSVNNGTFISLKKPKPSPAPENEEKRSPELVEVMKKSPLFSIWIWVWIGIILTTAIAIIVVVVAMYLKKGKSKKGGR